MLMRKRLACCGRDTREISVDFDEYESKGITTYNGLESCILNSHSFDNEGGTSRGDGCVTDSFDDDESTCSSSTNAIGSSFSSLWTMMKRDDQCRDAVKEKQNQFSDAETMKEKFAKLLLGEDVTGGAKGVSTASALSNAITNLAAAVFGELWKLEPLAEERKRKWRREMDWLLSPTNYMVELVPAKQSGSNGGIVEIMKPKARADIQMNLPALMKLDCMLLEMLDSMVDNEFWYTEVGSRAEQGRIRRWWLPSPQVPTVGLSDTERKRLLHQGRLIYQVCKAAKSINEDVLLEMPIPNTIREALSKSGKASLGDELYTILTEDPLSAEEMIHHMNLKSEHHALDAINRLEAAIFAWKGRISEEQGHGKSPGRTSWSFMKDPITEMDKIESLVHKAVILVKCMKMKYPNLPQTFLDATKIRYAKDVGHSILEAYSRVLANLGYSILSRIADILQEDITSNPNSPVAMSHLVGARIPGISDSPMLDKVRHSLIHQMNTAEECKTCTSTQGTDDNSDDTDTNHQEVKITSSANATPWRSRVWCIGREACHRVSAQNSPEHI